MDPRPLALTHLQPFPLPPPTTTLMYGHHLDRHLLPRLDAGLSAFPLHRAGGALAAPTPASSVRPAYCPQVVPLWLAVSNSPRQSQIPNLGTLTEP